MKCLSLLEPWATLFAAGEKKIETRSWRWPGDLPAVLAIHASKTFSTPQRLLCEQEPFQSALRRAGWYDREIPLGKVVGVVRLVECVTTSVLSTIASPILSQFGIPCLARKYLETFPNERAFGDYAPGRYAWAADRFGRFVEPIPLVGRRGVFEWNTVSIVEGKARSILGRPMEEAFFTIKV